ncbi:MAG: LysR substrate-binding domain-containing protein [Pseudomonadota bacterium]
MSSSPRPARLRPLSVGPLRAFECVARLLSFRAAAEELHLTQSAISRQIQSLEEELGASLFSRGTRHVALTTDGATLLRAVAPLLDRLDAGVRQIRHSKGRRVVSVSTFASFASLWLIPQLGEFQRQHPDIDIRISASDTLVDLNDGDVDLVLRYANQAQVPPDARHLFGEVLSPVISPWRQARIDAGDIPPLQRFEDLAQHTLAEEEDSRTSAYFSSWRCWLEHVGQPQLQPRRWLYLNYTHQQVQAALAGQAVALARMALVSDLLQRGELLEPFGPQHRITSPYAYWLASAPQSRERSEVKEFEQWVLERAEQTHLRMGLDLAATAANAVPSPTSPALNRQRPRRAP